MGPVNDATALVPFVLAAKLNAVAGSNAVDARCQIDVVANQHGVSAADAQNEALMSRSLEVITKNFLDGPFTFYDDSRASLLEEISNSGCRLDVCRLRFRCRARSRGRRSCRYRRRECSGSVPGSVRVRLPVLIDQNSNQNDHRDEPKRAGASAFRCRHALAV